MDNAEACFGGLRHRKIFWATHSTSPAISWRSEILAQLATSLGQRIWEGRPRVGVGGAQTQHWSDGPRRRLFTGPDGLVSMQRLHSGARWMLCMRRQGGGSARRARLSHASPEMRSDQLAPLPLHCP